MDRPHPAAPRSRPGAHRRTGPAWQRQLAVGGVLAVAVGLLASATGAHRALPFDLVGRARPAATAAAEGDEPDAPPGTITLAFGGDVHAEGRIRSHLARDPSALLAGVRPVLEAADLAMVNLETAVTDRGRAPAGKQYAFRGPASLLEGLKAGGVDVATAANNHGVDFGRAGLEDTVAAAEAAGLPLVGIGADAASAYRPHVADVRGTAVAIIGATQVLDSSLRAAWTATDEQPGLAVADDVERLTGVVHEARQTADVVVVYVHWGVESQTCPSGAQRELAEQLVAAGADVVVGSHAHRLQGAGTLGDAFVAYGLGNFVFYADGGPGVESGVLTVTLTGRKVDGARFHPARIVDQLPRLLEGGAAASASRAFDALRGCTGLDPAPAA